MGYDFDRNGVVDGRDFYLMNELLSDDDEFEDFDESDDDEETVNIIDENRFILKGLVSQLIDISVQIESIMDDCFANGDDSGPFTPLDYLSDANTYTEQAYEAIEEALRRSEGDDI